MTTLKKAKIILFDMTGLACVIAIIGIIFIWGLLF